MTPMGRLHVGSFARALINGDFTTTLTLVNMMTNDGKRAMVQLNSVRLT